MPVITQQLGIELIFNYEVRTEKSVIVAFKAHTHVGWNMQYSLNARIYNRDRMNGSDRKV